jgi:hypothetical protein
MLTFSLSFAGLNRYPAAMFDTIAVQVDNASGKLAHLRRFL